MSLILVNSDPKIDVKTHSFPAVLAKTVGMYYRGKVDADLDMDDFCQMVCYVLTNTRIYAKDDPRLHLVDFVKLLRPVVCKNRKDSMGIPTYLIPEDPDVTWASNPKKRTRKTKVVNKRYEFISKEVIRSKKKVVKK